MMYRLPLETESLFAAAAEYRRRASAGEVRETAAHGFLHTERHLQAVWFDEHLRPRDLKTSRGEPVTVESPGRWNLEAGPDFSGAVLLAGRERRRIAGDAEVHISPGDWKSHGHHNDPRYAGVRFHITWFAGKPDARLFPPGTVHISLAGSCAVDFDSIDLSAYPYHEPHAAEHFPFAGEPPDKIIRMIESAGEERFRQKTLRMAWLIQRRGEAQALYEETAAALGYKHNKAPFRSLAQKLPLEALEPYGADWKKNYSVLLGISGLLPQQPACCWPETAKKELRSLWDLWWREQHKWDDVDPLLPADWRLAGVRPLNHPVRRLCALAQWTAFGFFQTSRTAVSAGFKKCFWTEHAGWSGKEKPAELIGPDRLHAIELNVLIPYRLAKGDGSALQNLPVEPVNSIIRETAYTLFGPDHSPQLYRTALARQGLIQIFNDFILSGRTDELSSICG